LNNILQKIIEIITLVFSGRTHAEIYLSQAIDHADLKARECRLKYGGFM